MSVLVLVSEIAVGLLICMSLVYSRRSKFVFTPKIMDKNYLSRTMITRVAYDATDFLGWAVEAGIGLLVWAIIFGDVVYPQWLLISTSGWSTYSALLWGVTPFLALAVFVLRLIESAKAGWSRPYGY